jgi:hypothetical protein
MRGLKPPPPSETTFSAPSKAIDFIHFIGTTEVVPFHKADAEEFFSSL